MESTELSFRAGYLTIGIASGEARCAQHLLYCLKFRPEVAAHS
jgi:hypothetical protein